MALLRIDDVVPRQGWPGTLVEIQGDGFNPHADDNKVVLAGLPALIVRASDALLLVVVPDGAQTGTLSVETGGQFVDWGAYEILPWPDVEDLLLPAAPRFFHGPQHGTPSSLGINQRVLVLPAFTTDIPPPAAPPDPLAAIDTKFQTANDFWRVSSWGQKEWRFERHPNWLPLPKARPYYIIDQSHIDAARFSYLAGDRRIVGDSGFVFGAAGVGFTPVAHPSPLSWSFLIGKGADSTPHLALRKVGSLLYVGTKGGQFAIYDVTAPGNAALVGSVALGSPAWDIDFIGTNAVVALGPAGLGVLDISNPTNPSVLIAGVGATTEWTTRVKTAGTRIYSNRGDKLYVHDLTAMVTLAHVAHVPAGAWIMDVDISGNRCVVATDGRGLLTLEITAGGVLERLRHLDFRYPREIAFVGTTAFVAASDAGLAAIDFANLSAPVTLGSLKLKKDANSLIVQGNEAVVAVGSVVLVSVDIGDPAAMTLNGIEQATSQNLPMADRRAFLQSRIDDINKAVDFDRIFLDALRAWFADGGTTSALDGYEGIAVIMTGPEARATSRPAGGLSTGGEGMPFNGVKGLFYDDIGGHWTTLAHELIHWLRDKDKNIIGDIYEERFTDGRVIVGTGGDWCLSGKRALAPLFCAQRLTDALGWMSVGSNPAQNVRELVWTPTSQVDEPFDIVAHGANQDTDPERVHALRLRVSSGMTYWVEVRQNTPPGLPFDQQLPLGALPGCVLVTRSTDAESVVDNTHERPIQLIGALQVGQQAVDASRNLIITAEQVLTADPLTYRVRVQWNQPIPENPGGTFDLAITPWDTVTYETRDIWVDSKRRNDLGHYEFHEPGDDTRPVLSGDRPWVHHENIVHARIANTGPQRVEDIFVSCYITQPPGIGDNGEWQLLDTKQVPFIDGHGNAEVTFTWVPEIANHTCISVAILPKLGEITGGNNRAQENVAVFDSPSGSSHQPVLLEAMVRNPFTIGKRVDLLVRDLPDRWHAVVDRSYVWLGPSGSAPVKIVIWTDLQSFGLEGEEGERLAKPVVEGWILDDHVYRPIGGILAPVRAVPGVKIDFALEQGGGLSTSGDTSRHPHSKSRSRLRSATRPGEAGCSTAPRMRRASLVLPRPPLGSSCTLAATPSRFSPVAVRMLLKRNPKSGRSRSPRRALAPHLMVAMPFPSFRRRHAFTGGNRSKPWRTLEKWNGRLRRLAVVLG